MTQTQVIPDVLPLPKVENLKSSFSNSTQVRLGIKPVAEILIQNNHVERLTELRDAANVLAPCEISQPIPRRSSNRRSIAAEFARGVIESKDYQNSLKLRAANGTLPPAVEITMWAYAYGKPDNKLVIEEDSSRENQNLSADQLVARSVMLTASLQRHAAHEKGQCGSDCDLCKSVKDSSDKTIDQLFAEAELAAKGNQ